MATKVGDTSREAKLNLSAKQMGTFVPDKYQSQYRSYSHTMLMVTLGQCTVPIIAVIILARRFDPRNFLTF